jgi:hypothetical protein
MWFISTDSRQLQGNEDARHRSCSRRTMYFKWLKTMLMYYFVNSSETCYRVSSTIPTVWAYVNPNVFLNRGGHHHSYGLEGDPRRSAPLGPVLERRPRRFIDPVK